MKKVAFAIVLIVLIVGIVFGGMSVANAAKPTPKQTPTPTPITGLEARVGNLETAVANLQSQQAEMSKQIGNLTSALESAVTDLEAANLEMSNQIAILTSQLQALQECVVCPPQPLFEDDFEDAAWTLANWEVESGDWQVVDGTFACLSNGGRAVAGNLSWTDYTLYVDVMGMTVDKNIDFRRSDNNGYWVDLRAAPYNDIVLCKDTEGNGQCYIATGYVVNYAGTWYSLKIQVVGNAIKVYVDDNLIINYVDTSPTVPQGSGRIGFDTFSAPSIYLDNVKVIPE